MKISLKWLSDYVDLSDVPLNDVIDKLSLSGLEVEEVIDRKALLKNMVVGLVKEKNKHPNADKLSLCVVSDGEKDYPVVCGAPNVEAGQKVAFAKVGSVIPQGGFKLKKAKIRGEVSEGMICAEDELGISDDHEGIMVLDDKLAEGKDLAEALGFDDVVVDVAITPNRPDALSIIGVARDLAAIFGKKLFLPKFELNEESFKSSELADVEIIDFVNCPRYVAKVVKDITVKDSPDWLKSKLTSIGLRPINNIVDITNFVLYEIGQPLHAFDLDELSGKKIIVKQAGKDRKFTTLDSKARNLQEQDLMICDAEKHVAVAGVMGGENSEVSGKTKDILIESAYFNPSSVRRTSRLLGLSTDASYRFERGTDPEITLWAARRAAQLMTELAGGKIAKGEIDVYPSPFVKKNVSLRFKRVEKILGYPIPDNITKKVLQDLGFKITEESETTHNESLS
ncbi:phenylalanine--tRNA ligase subunit beta, partial [Bacteroidota bacterium]